MGFIGCSERQPSWLSEFSEFSSAGGWLAGWIRWQCQISDINHQPLLLPSSPPLSAVMPFHSPLLHSTSSLEPVKTNLPFYWNSSSVSTYLHVYPHLCVPSCFPNSHAHTEQQQTGRQCRLCYEWHPLAHPEEVYAPVWLYKLSPLSWE